MNILLNGCKILTTLKSISINMEAPRRIQLLLHTGKYDKRCQESKRHKKNYRDKELKNNRFNDNWT